ncbi:ferrous iron transport protein B [bacterium]|nr:ferrous iron transport protein B [bacterium]
MTIRIALAGNPNCGKTTLFNRLTGSTQFVGNWPGVTIEKKEGRVKGFDDLIVTDLPGIYSLSPYSLEEVVTRNYIVKERPDAMIDVVDGTNLERNLYLTTQLTELGIPVVIAINMIDVVEKRGDVINIEELGERIGCKVIRISALNGEGVSEVLAAAVEAATGPGTIPHHIFSGGVEHALAHIEEAAVHSMPEGQQRWYAVKIFERDEKIYDDVRLSDDVKAHIESDIVAAEKELGDDSASIITNERYNYIESITKVCYRRKSAQRRSISAKIDKVLTNRILALPIFAAVMFIVYYVSVTTVGAWVTDFMNDGLFGDGFNLFGAWIPGVPVLAERALDAIGCAGWLKALLVDGIIGGVGAVLGFVPQMFVLFIFLAFLEGCGYVARIAFIMDRIFKRFGLSGKSFISILVGTGCGVPGIMASRTIENERDRRMTIITTTFIPCGAKLPIIALVASALFGGASWVAPSAYFLGVFAIGISGIILKKTKIFAGESAPFVMELPDYHMPTAGNILHSMWERGWSFIRKAGTVILLASVIIWGGSSLGWPDGGPFAFKPGMELPDSIIGHFGNVVRWVFAPLGFNNIQAAIATVMGLVAKEEVVGVFGVLDFKGLSPLAAYSFLIFNLLCAPCFAAIGAIRREMNSVKWTLFAVAYQTVLAYAFALIIYQFGLLFSGEVNVAGLIFALIVLASGIYLLVRRGAGKEADHGMARR